MNEREVMHFLVPIAIVALILWRLHSRVRRMIGRQRLSTGRSWFNVVLFPLIVVLLAVQGRSQELLAVSLAGGAAAGIALGILGLKLTRFETTSEGRFYTPSAHIGIALSALLILRIGWRLIVSGGIMLPEEGAPPPQPPTLTPLTFLLVGIVAGYYWTYAVGLLRWSFRKEPVTQAPSAP
jgi:cytochrome c biogenesis factor